MTPQEILNLELGENDAKARTVRDYLLALLETLWRDGEMFSGKRPFGNSSWEFELYVPLIKAEAVDGTLDEDGYVEEIDTGAADAMIVSAIRALHS